MAQIISQDYLPIKDGTLVATVVRMEGSGSETIDIPRMSSNPSQEGADAVAQILRPGDTALTEASTDLDTMTLSGGTAGQEVLLVSHSDRPIVNPVS